MTVRRAREVTLLAGTADAPRRVMRGFSYSSHSVSEVAGWRREVRAPSWDCHRFASLARNHHNMRRVHARDHSGPTSGTRLRDGRRLCGRPFSAGPGGLRRYPWLRPCRCTPRPHSSHLFPRKRRASGIACPAWGDRVCGGSRSHRAAVAGGLGWDGTYVLCGGRCGDPRRVGPLRISCRDSVRSCLTNVEAGGRTQTQENRVAMKRAVALMILVAIYGPPPPSAPRLP